MFFVSRYGNNGCRRTYLSGRDLQAHIAHRHSDKREKAGDRDKGRDKEKDKEDNLNRSVNSISKASLASVLAAVNSAASTYNSYTAAAGGQLSTAVTASSSSGTFTQVTQSHGGSGMNISVLNTRPPGNLITVHHQEASGAPAPASGQAGSYGGYSAPAGGYHNYHSAPPAASGPAVTYPNLSQPPPTYSGYSGYSGSASAASASAGYQGYQAATAYSSLTAGPPPGTAQPQAAGSAYASAGGQPGSVAGGYAAAGGQPGAGYGANGGYSVAPGGQHWTRPPPATQNSGYYRR